MGTWRGVLKSRSSGGTCSTNSPRVRRAQSSHVEYMLTTALSVAEPAMRNSTCWPCHEEQYMLTLPWGTVHVDPAMRNSTSDHGSVWCWPCQRIPTNSVEWSPWILKVMLPNKTFWASCKAEMFITVWTRSHQVSLCWTKWIQSMVSNWISSSKTSITFQSRLLLHGVRLLAPHSNPHVRELLLSAVRSCMFAATWRPLRRIVMALGAAHSMVFCAHCETYL
jgi:hypothetical protein